MSKGDADAAGVTATLSDAYDKVSDTVVTAYSAARGKAVDAAQATGLGAGPFAAILGGLALGAIAGALVPRGAKEAETLAPLGGRIADAAKAALAAAREAGTDALDEAGISEDNLRSQVSHLFEQVSNAASAAGTAAFSAARDSATK